MSKKCLDSVNDFFALRFLKAKVKGMQQKSIKLYALFNSKTILRYQTHWKKHYYMLYLRLLKGIRTLVKLKVKVKVKEHIEITSRSKLVLAIYFYFIALFWIVHHIWGWSFFPSGTFVSRPRNSCRKIPENFSKVPRTPFL